MYRLTEDNHCLRGYRWDDFESGQTINRGIEDNLIIALDRLGEYEDTGLQPEEVADRLEWISVEDKLPHNGDIVMTYRPEAESCGMVPYRVETYHGHRFGGQTPYNGEVSHWMYLPDPPKEAINGLK